MAFTRTQARNLCETILACDSPREIAAHCLRVARSLPVGQWVLKEICCDTGDCTYYYVKNAWRKELRRFAMGLLIAEQGGALPYTIFAEGNSKLPFYCFSVLPEYTCPGAGECLRFCYSFTAWRYPAALLRQIQNTIALRFFKGHIRAAWAAIPDGSVVRLYVDGDIDSIGTLLFWSRLLSQRPRTILAYGYSKSFEVFEDFANKGLVVPDNYLLNLSSGSKYDGTDIVERMANHPNTRGRFVTVPIGKHAKGFERFESKEYHAEVRAIARELFGTMAVFSCPGDCGDCITYKGKKFHACGADGTNGSPDMSGVLIAIGEHN